MNKKKMKKEIYSFNEILLKKGKKVCTLNNGYICNSEKADEIIRMFCELPTNAKGDGLGFRLHRVCVIANV